MILDFESDQFLKLLTDALRAGPGSPQWHEAVLRLQAAEGGAGVSEYKMLCDARSHLESGKEYRSIRPGPGFTRKVMTAIETETPRGSGFPTATLIAVVAGLLIVGALVTAGIYLLPAGSVPPGDPAAIERLSATVLGNPITSVSFDSGAPADWRVVGKLPLDFTHEMRSGKPKPDARVAAGNGPAGGGLVYSTVLPADAPFAVEAVLHLGRPTEELLPEVVISDQADFANDNATTAHELVTLVQSGQARVILPDGRLEGQTAVGRGNLTVKVTIDRTSAIVECEGKRLWAGLHGLAADQPRYVAVRLLRSGGDHPDLPAISSVRVLK